MQDKESWHHQDRRDFTSENAKKYYGQVRVHDGTPETPKKEGYWPGMCADIWTTAQRPTHDYPMAVAESCITLYVETEEKVLRGGKCSCVSFGVGTREDTEHRAAQDPAERVSAALSLAAHTGSC